jgi:hypothetical protein
MKNPAAGGGRWVEVPPERLVSWIVAFAIRHGGARPVSHDETGLALTFTAADGATAQCHPPFPPIPEAGRPDAHDAKDAEGTKGAKNVENSGGTKDANDAKDVESAEDVEDAVGEAEAMVAHALADRTVGVLLVRLGGYAVGVFAGSPPELVSSKTGSRLVHGRSAAGGWSQHRFARRRENQAAAAIFGPYGTDGLDAVVLGGDKRSIAGLRGDARLEPYLAKAADRFLTVPDPRLAVLRQIPQAFTSIRIRLTEPGGTR